MTLFDDLIDVNRRTVNLLEVENDSGGTRVLAEAKISQTPTTQKVSPDEPRMDYKELENAYIFDPIIFNMINKTTQTIMSAGHEIYAKDEKSLKRIQEFVDNIGNVGGDMTWEEYLESCFKNMGIFGWQWSELVQNEDMSKIYDLVVIDPKRMDYVKNSSGKIALNDFGKPLGYTHKLPWSFSSKSKGDKLPENTILGDNEIFIKPERIALFKLYTVGDGFYPIGLIEPGYKSTLRKMNIEEAQSNSIYARGTYPIIDYVGNIDHQPSPDMIQNATEKLKNLAHHRYFAFPYWHKIEPIEVKQSEVVDKTLEHLRQNQIAPSGMPMAFATGAGEQTNRATLTNQQALWEFTLNYFVSRVISSIRKYVFKPICEKEGLKEVPTIKWGNISAEEINDKAKRLYMYTKYGILKPEEVNAFVKKSEQI